MQTFHPAAVAGPEVAVVDEDEDVAEDEDASDEVAAVVVHSEVC